ncbi:MAG: hypothetical protein QOE45_549 [Frankiaceae bacterium]|jgi:hypothetical protein|nr:hypothetical protein [Frankiaceae bacterium]
MAERRAAEAAAAAAERGPGAAHADAPDALQARPRRRFGAKVFVGVAVLLLLLRVGLARRPEPPALAASCTTPAFALSATTVKQARPVSFTIVGPDSGRYVIGVNTTGFRHQPEGGYVAVPIPGREKDVITGAGVQPMKGCRRTGYFALPISPGDATVTLYELTSTGTVELAHRTVTVTPP